MKATCGLVGLGVMGANLIKNIESRGYHCAVYNRSFDVTEKFMQEVSGKNFVAAKTYEEFVNSIQTPRQVYIMVNAGKPVDLVLDSLLPLLSKGDIVLECGNSLYKDTLTREKRCSDLGIYFLGTGVSGGAEGALKGPSIMPGGAKEAWEIAKPVLEKIAANVDGPCVTHIGPNGSGHYVKMVHNGIEYGDMQMIAEGYHMLRNFLGCQPEELSKIFAEWNKGVLSSFLIEITSKIFTKKDEDGKAYLVDKILDRAEQKGTGKWTAQDALDYGVAIPSLAVAVDARILSSQKQERINAAKELVGPENQSYKGDRQELINAIHDALYCSKIVSYAQGMALIQKASEQMQWGISLGKLAAIWKGGCIIRAKFLDTIRKAYEANPKLANLLLDPSLKEEMKPRLTNWRKVVALAAERGIPCMAFSTALAYYDSYRTENLPQNLTQAQRDFFGSHTYERNDKAGIFHTEW